jgi:hypothetical protein
VILAIVSPGPVVYTQKLFDMFAVFLALGITVCVFLAELVELLDDDPPLLDDDPPLLDDDPPLLDDDPPLLDDDPPLLDDDPPVVLVLEDPPVVLVPVCVVLPADDAGVLPTVLGRLLT